MDVLFQIKSSLDSLSNKEFTEFIQTSNILNKRYLIDTIYKSYQYKFEHVKSIDKLNNILIPNLKKMKKNVYQIIGKRIEKKTNNKSNQQHQNDKEAIKINNIPKEMISYISSFLDIKSIISFEQTDKSIFIGVRSGISVYSLNGKNFAKCIAFGKKYNINCHWNRFKSIKKIMVDTKALTKHKCGISSVPSIIWKNIKSLAILRYPSHELLQDIKQLQLFNSISLDTLKYIDCDDDYNTEYLEYLMNLMNANSNLQYLEFYCYRMFNFNNILWCNSLKGLCFETGSNEDFNDIISKIGYQLESLHFGGDNTFKKGVKYNFNNLREICMEGVNTVNIQILNNQNLKYLQRIQLGLDDDYYNQQISQDDIEKLIQNPKLNYISIDDENNSSIKILENVLKNGTYKKLKIRVKFGSIKKLDLSKLINLLKIKCSHWMFICSLDIRNNDKNFAELVTNLNKQGLLEYNKTKNCNPDPFDFTKHNFVASNQQCVINGYQERWIMECTECALYDQWYHMR